MKAYSQTVPADFIPFIPTEMGKAHPFSKLILHEDEHLLLINKPSGIASLDERNGEGPSILAMARKHDLNVQLCHRLDKETSGVLAIARDPETYREMAMNFEQRKVTKTYHAIVSGVLNVTQQRIVLPLSMTRNGIAKVDMKDGKMAETVVTTLRNFRHYTLLECQPLTGRLHQIRIHLAAQHYPIAGDITYGGKIPMLSWMKKDFNLSKWTNEEGIMRRVALHAYELRFTLNEHEYAVQAPYPKDFEVFLKLLDKHDSYSE